MVDSLALLSHLPCMCAAAATDEIRWGALLTDLYQLTMAYGYWRSGKAEQEAVFHLSFRKHAFSGGFSIAAGLEDAVRYLAGFRFTESDIAYLAELTGADGKPLFTLDFLKYLGALRLSLDVHAIPEGTVVFPHEPLMRVQGPILQAQLIETALLNFLNFQTLVATKAARVCLAAGGDPVIEFGLRRAQGPDGGLSASRAAFLGGCDATSNVLAGKLLGIPVKGTHAHSWVMAFANELDSFLTYADAMPNNCIFLVDTYNTLEGVRHAIEAGRKLKAAGHKLAGIRLDSGDLAYLSVEARRILDEAGFPDAVIVASNDLDEHLVTSLKQQGAAIKVWGIGTKLVTAFDQPALGGVYKLSALRSSNGQWERKIKLSEQTVKVTNPGILQVRRFQLNDEFIGDAICDELSPAPESFSIVDPVDPIRRKQIPADASSEDLLVPLFKDGKQVYELPSLTSIRDRARNQLARLHPGIKRFENPHLYPAGLELSLHELKTRMILAARGI